MFLFSIQNSDVKEYTHIWLMEQESSASGLNMASPAFSSLVWETALGMLAAEVHGSHTTLQRTGLQALHCQPQSQAWGLWRRPSGQSARCVETWALCMFQ